MVYCNCGTTFSMNVGHKICNKQSVLGENLNLKNFTFGNSPKVNFKPVPYILIHQIKTSYMIKI